jgi:hypothetical protein
VSVKVALERTVYLPPPAQAQAQPAHAQAQAQAQPPLRRDVDDVLVPVLTGCVRCVTPPVKLSSRSTTLLDVRSIPATTVLANAAPGKVGSVICRPPPLEDRPLLGWPLPPLGPGVLTLAARTAGTQGR